MLGSVNIDRSAHEFIEARLQAIRHHLPRPPHQIAWEMVSGRFERFKCEFNLEKAQVPNLLLDIPGLHAGSHFPEARIEKGQMAISM